MLVEVERLAGRPLSGFDPRTVPDERPPSLVIHDRQEKEAPYAEGVAVQASWPTAELLLEQCEEKAIDGLVFGNSETFPPTATYDDGAFARCAQSGSRSGPDLPLAAMTLDTYPDLFDDDLDAVAIALNDTRRSSIAARVRPEMSGYTVRSRVTDRSASAQFGRHPSDQ